MLKNIKFCAPFALLVVLGFFVSVVPSVSSAATKSPKKKASKTKNVKNTTPAAPPACKAELLMDPKSGKILFERNSTEALPPASMVKLMTAYVTLKHIELGAVQLSDIVTASARASKMGGSQVYLKENEQFTLQELMDAMLIQSGNDAAAAIAEYVGGSVEGFVAMMNVEAKALGMQSADFQTPHGLPPGKGQTPDLVSARDMAILGRALMQRYPQVLTITGKVEAPFRNGAFTMRNHNHVLRHYQGCDGLKTGYYTKAGFCTTTTAERNGTRVLAVAMGCSSYKFRDAEVSRLMSEGFALIRMQAAQLVEQKR